MVGGIQLLVLSVLVAAFVISTESAILISQNRNIDTEKTQNKTISPHKLHLEEKDEKSMKPLEEISNHLSTTNEENKDAFGDLDDPEFLKQDEEEAREMYDAEINNKDIPDIKFNDGPDFTELYKNIAKPEYMKTFLEKVNVPHYYNERPIEVEPFRFRGFRVTDQQ